MMLRICGLKGGRAVITANENSLDAIKLHADAGAFQTISVLNDEGTDNNAINLTSSAGGIHIRGRNRRKVRSNSRRRSA